LSDTTKTTWPIEPHTQAKHQILEEYLKAWFPILSTRHGRVVYLDGFAGPGRYEGGEAGSPVVAITTAVQHKLSRRFREIVFWFIEKDRDRAQMLEQIIKEQFPNLPSNFKCEVQSAEFAPTLESVLSNIEKKGAKLAPTFAFLDPFGFSGFPMKTVKRLIAYERCEVLVTFMIGFVNRFAREQAQNVDELYGTSDWQRIPNLKDPQEKERQWIDLYEQRLKESGATYVRTFGMIGEQNRTIYYLVYATKSEKGMEVMKEAMYKVDRRGLYRFSDITDPGQTYVIDYADEPHWLPHAAEAILSKFRRQRVPVEYVRNFVITATPFLYRSSILKHLEKSQEIVKVTGRERRLTYPDGCLITFA
jgi:three-Cys-motif partner protein